MAFLTDSRQGKIYKYVNHEECSSLDPEDILKAGRGPGDVGPDFTGLLIPMIQSGRLKSFGAHFEQPLHEGVSHPEFKKNILQKMNTSVDAFENELQGTAKLKYNIVPILHFNVDQKSNTFLGKRKLDKLFDKASGLALSRKNTNYYGSIDNSYGTRFTFATDKGKEMMRQGIGYPLIRKGYGTLGYHVSNPRYTQYISNMMEFNLSNKSKNQVKSLTLFLILMKKLLMLENNEKF